MKPRGMIDSDAIYRNIRDTQGLLMRQRDLIKQTFSDVSCEVCGRRTLVIAPSALTLAAART